MIDKMEQLHDAARIVRGVAKDAGYGTSFGFVRRLRMVAQLIQLCAEESCTEEEEEIRERFTARVRLLAEECEYRAPGGKGEWE